LAYSRAREAALTERLAWYQAAQPKPELRIVGEKACVIPTVSARKLGDKARASSCKLQASAGKEITAGHSAALK
jgi:hypothetical protein